MCPDDAEEILLQVGENGFRIVGMGDLGSSNPFEPGTVNPEDAISGSSQSIQLCEGDALIVKPWCVPPEATILDVSLFVKGVNEVIVYFIDINGGLITESKVREY